MSERFFLDTNIFLYPFDPKAPDKAETARSLIRQALANQRGAVSYQVVQEFFNVALKRIAHPMQVSDAQQYLTEVFRPLLAVYSSTAYYGEALRLFGGGGLSWHDALIVAAAQQAGCEVLYTEDLQHGRKFGAVRVVNPFL